MVVVVVVKVVLVVVVVRFLLQRPNLRHMGNVVGVGLMWLVVEALAFRGGECAMGTCCWRRHIGNSGSGVVVIVGGCSGNTGGGGVSMVDVGGGGSTRGCAVDNADISVGVGGDVMMGGCAMSIVLVVQVVVVVCGIVACDGFA